MKRVIFSCYDEIDDMVNDEERHWIFMANEQSVEEYFDRLVKNKKEYCEKIGADWIFYRNEIKDFDVKNEMQFTKVNLYKHHLFAKLAEEYDEVMYVDMDVVFNTDLNVFDELDLSKGIAIKDMDDEIQSKEVNDVLYSSVGMRNPTLKYHITKDLLDGGDNHVINTGIMIGKSEHIKQIKYVERMQEAYAKIQDIRLYEPEDPDNKDHRQLAYLRINYYANNESIFSYILEKYKVPYQIMDDKWHWIVDHRPNDTKIKDANIIHFINKKFNAFFKDKTTAIYSIHIDIPDDKLDDPVGPPDDDVNKSKRTKDRLAQYKDRLIENHEWYAKEIGSKYIHFKRDEQYEEFLSKFPDLSEYDVINLYKVWLLDKLTYDYDLVLYVDLDVYFTKPHSIFDYVPASTTFCCQVQTARNAGVRKASNDYYKWYNFDFRSPHSKFWNAHAMLEEEGYESDQYIFNTGIMVASRAVMEQIDYFSDIDDVIQMMKDLKEDEFSMYLPQIQSAFGYDNETIMAYKTKKNKVKLFPLPKRWHHKHLYRNLKAFTHGTKEHGMAKRELETEIGVEGVIMVHLISKNFELVFDEA